MTDHLYSLTEGSIKIPRDKANSLAPRFMKQGDSVRHSTMVTLFGDKEVKRFIAQGWLKVVGLKEGLELGTIIPDHPTMPTELDLADPHGTQIKSAKDGNKPRNDLAGQPAPSSIEADSGVAAALASIDASREEQAAAAAAPPSPTAPAAATGQTVGKWTADPTTLQSLDIGVLNALIKDKDPTAQTFAEGQETAARAFLSKDFGTTPEQVQATASGSVNPAEDNPGVRAVMQAPSTSLNPSVVES